jgi:hypothetical protein
MLIVIYQKTFKFAILSTCFQMIQTICKLIIIWKHNFLSSIENLCKIYIIVQITNMIIFVKRSHLQHVETYS